MKTHIHKKHACRHKHTTPPTHTHTHTHTTTFPKHSTHTLHKRWIGVWSAPLPWIYRDQSEADQFWRPQSSHTHQVCLYHVGLLLICSSVLFTEQRWIPKLIDRRKCTPLCLTGMVLKWRDWMLIYWQIWRFVCNCLLYQVRVMLQVMLSSNYFGFILFFVICVAFPLIDWSSCILRWWRAWVTLQIQHMELKYSSLFPSLSLSLAPWM